MRRLPAAVPAAGGPGRRCRPPRGRAAAATGQGDLAAAAARGQASSVRLRYDLARLGRPELAGHGWGARLQCHLSRCRGRGTARWVLPPDELLRSIGRSSGDDPLHGRVLIVTRPSSHDWRGLVSDIALPVWRGVNAVAVRCEERVGRVLGDCCGRQPPLLTPIGCVTRPGRNLSPSRIGGPGGRGAPAQAAAAIGGSDGHRRVVARVAEQEVLPRDPAARVLTRGEVDLGLGRVQALRAARSIGDPAAGPASVPTAGAGCGAAEAFRVPHTELVFPLVIAA